MRRLLLVLVAALLVPLVLLAMLELLLRWTGYGYDLRFWVPESRGETTVYRTNQTFTYTFFPPALARGIIPHAVTMPKPPDTFRLFLFGESAANGDPDPAYGLAPQLEALLEDRFPGTDFEIICTAVTAINSHVILPLARESARLDGDLWIVYMGNNEMVGPFGASTRFGPQAPPLATVRLGLALRRTRLGQAVDNLIGSLRGESETPEQWGGIEMFTDHLLAPDDPALAQVYSHFADNLDAMLQAAEEAGVPVLLSTVASNLRDCGPFASLSEPSLSSADRSRAEALRAQGRALLGQRQFAAAAEAFASARELDRAHAETHYLLGTSWRFADQAVRAREAFVQARDRDALRVRADGVINGLIRDQAAARADRGVMLFDAEGLLSAQVEDGTPGMGLFLDHVHFTFTGTYTLARALAEAIIPRLPAVVHATDRGSWMTAAEVFRERALSGWDQARIWREMAARQDTPPYDGRVGGRAAVNYCAYQARQAEQARDPEADRRLYAEALAARPDDYYLRERWAEYLLHHGEIEAAIDAWRWLTRAYPGYEGGYQNLGIALLLAGRTAEATAAFARVLVIRPGYARAQQALEMIAEGRVPEVAVPAARAP